jgi:hypothetical protein
MVPACPDAGRLNAPAEGTGVWAAGERRGNCPGVVDLARGHARVIPLARVRGRIGRGDHEWGCPRRLGIPSGGRPSRNICW